jgi:hypothetical protein
MSTTRWCGACRSAQTIEWQEDRTFGERSESARCPRCGTVWGVRTRREPVPSETAAQGEKWCPGTDSNRRPAA